MGAEVVEVSVRRDLATCRVVRGAAGVVVDAGLHPITVLISSRTRNVDMASLEIFMILSDGWRLPVSEDVEKDVAFDPCSNTKCSVIRSSENHRAKPKG